MIKTTTELEIFKETINQMPYGIGLFDISSGKPFFLNHAYYEQLGYSPEEYAKLHQDCVYNGLYLMDVPMKDKSADEFHNKGKALNYEYRIITKDGSIRWVKMNSAEMQIGGVKFAFASFLDITKEKEAYLQVTMIAENTNSSVALYKVVNGVETLVYANATYFEMLGVSREEYEKDIHAFDHTFVTKEDHERIRKAVEATYETGKSIEIEHEFNRPDGKKLWLNRRYRAISQEEPGPYMLVSIVTDRTEKKKTQDAEHEQNIMMSNLLNELPGGVSILKITDKLECIYFSDGFAAMTGRTREEVTRMLQDEELLKQGISLENYHDFLKHLKRNNPIGKTFSFTYHLILENGEVGWLHVAATKIREEDGAQIYYCVYTNPTDESALYRSVVEDSAIGVFVADRKTRTNYYINEAGCKLCGFEAAKIAGKELDQILKEYGKQPLLTEEDISGLSFDHYSEFHFERKGLYLAVKAKALMWNGVDSYILYIADETQLLEDSKRAMQEQKYYRMILDMTGTAYFEWDAENGFYSSEDFQKYALSEGGGDTIIKGEHGKEYVYPDDFPVLMHHIAETIKGTSNQSVTVRMKMRDGHYQWTEIISYSECDSTGIVTKTIGVLRDVDKEWIERNKKLQAALDSAERANKAKTAFISRVSHDMRTPLNGILGLTSFLRDAVMDEQGKKDINQLEVSGQYLLNLINDTLDISRIENGKLELHPVICDGKAAFDNILKLARPSVEAKKQKFVVTTNEFHFTPLYWDVNRMEQVIMNIIGNAVKFTDEGGTIECAFEQLEETPVYIKARLSIRDNGIGMSKEFLPVIFDAFSQSDDVKANARKGTGLGMAITKQLVDLMGGTIQVESELGKGSCFTIEIPFTKATEKQIKEWKESVAREVDNSILKDKTVLLCEDHPLNREIEIRLLENKGIHVECAENGKAGIDLFSASKIGHYDLILMDVQMPVMDGLDATRKIRSMTREDADKIPIIAMTGNSFDEDIVKTMDAGMNAHLCKPIDSVKMFATLCDQLSNAHHYHRIKVLVVDDVELNRAVIQAAIAPDYDVIEASDGVEALQALEKDSTIDVVITDMMMLNMDGFELIKNMRANHNYDHIAIIANTQYGEMAKEEEIRKLGANGFIYKPNFPDSIINKLHEVLKQMN